jgi:drug/metabolite transporter (DMT)-like permease
LESNFHPLENSVFLSITGISIFNTRLYVSVQTTTAINASLITSIVYFALFPSLVAYFCWNKGVELIGANRAGLFINLIPVFASFMAVAGCRNH